MTVPTPEDVKARVASAYNSAADSYDHTANTFWSRFGRRTVERLGMAPGSLVLDLCCGTGASALPAAEAVGMGGRVVGVDLADELIRLAKEKAARSEIRNTEFHVADMLALEPGGRGFDYVVCVFGIFFVPDMASALHHVSGLLRPGGTLAVTTWGRGLFEPVNTIFWDAVRRARPELYKSFNPWDRIGDRSALADLFQEAGLPGPSIEIEPGAHTVRGEACTQALLLGTGYRGTLEQLSEAERRQVQEEVAEQIRRRGVTEVRADVIYVTWTKP